MIVTSFKETLGPVLDSPMGLIGVRSNGLDQPIEMRIIGLADLEAMEGTILVPFAPQ